MMAPPETLPDDTAAPSPDSSDQPRDQQPACRRISLGKRESSRYRFEMAGRELESAIYVVGAPNMGKSTLLGNLAEQFAGIPNRGVLVLDIKGDLAHEIASRTHHADRLVYFAPGECRFPEGDRTWALNPFEVDGRDRASVARVAAGIPSLFERLGLADLQQMANIRQTLEATTQLALRDAEPTLLHLPLLLYHEPTRERLLTRHVWPMTRVFWRKEFDTLTPSERRRKVGTTASRLTTLLSSPSINALVGTYRSTLRLREFLEQGKFVVCNLGTGLPREVGITIGNLIMGMLIEATYARPEHGRNAWSVIVDEFHLFVGNAFAEIITQARSYKLYPVLAHQGHSQLSGEAGRGAGSLQEAVTQAPLRFTLSGGPDDDRERFSAKLRYRRGPRGTPRTEELLLEDWWGDVVPGQLDRAIAAAADDRYTLPVRDVMRGNSARYWDLIFADEADGDGRAAGSDGQDGTDRTGRDARRGRSNTAADAGRQDAANGRRSDRKSGGRTGTTGPSRPVLDEFVDLTTTFIDHSADVDRTGDAAPRPDPVPSGAGPAPATGDDPAWAGDPDHPRPGSLLDEFPGE